MSRYYLLCSHSCAGRGRGATRPWYCPRNRDANTHSSHTFDPWQFLRWHWNKMWRHFLFLSTNWLLAAAGLVAGGMSNYLITAEVVIQLYVTGPLPVVTDWSQVLSLQYCQSHTFETNITFMVDTAEARILPNPMQCVIPAMCLQSRIVISAGLPGHLLIQVARCMHCS